METLQINRLKRNPEKIKSYFKTNGDITTVHENVRVIFPDLFIGKKLAIIGEITKVLSMYAILDEDDNYAVVNAPIMQTLSPMSIDNVSVNNTLCKSLSFQADNVFLPSNKLVVNNDFIFDIFDIFIIQGKVPWYFNYTDLSRIYIQANEYAATKGIGDDPLSLEIITSIIARSPQDMKIYYRHGLLKNKNINPTFVGLNNVFYSYDNTGAKIIGANFKDGIISAILDPETKSSSTSDILRS